MRTADLIQALADAPGVTVRPAEPVSRHGNLRMGGEVEAWIVVAHEEALATTLAALRSLKIKARITAGYDEILAREEGLAGVVIRLGRAFSSIAVQEDGLQCGVGAPLARIGAVARSLGLGGLAVLESHPGTFWSWLEDGGARSLGTALRSVRVLQGRTAKTVSGDEWRSAASGGVALAAVLNGTLPRHPVPPPPGAIAPLDAEFVRRLRRSGLPGLRLRRILLADEAPGVLVNLGQADSRDFDMVLRLVRERLHRDHGMEFQSRLVVAGRAARDPSEPGATANARHQPRRRT